MIQMAPNKWLYSSGGRASDWCRGHCSLLTRLPFISAQVHNGKHCACMLTKCSERPFSTPWYIWGHRFVSCWVPEFFQGFFSSNCLNKIIGQDNFVTVTFLDPSMVLLVLQNSLGIFHAQQILHLQCLFLFSEDLRLCIHNQWVQYCPEK